MKNKIKKIIIEVLASLNEDLKNKTLNNPTEDTKLYGSNEALDSVALVMFITDLEDRISDEFRKDIVLANEKAMSQRTSPFRNILSLTVYIQKILEEKK